MQPAVTLPSPRTQSRRGSSWVRLAAVVAVLGSVVGALTVVPHAYYGLDEAARLLREGRLEATEWSSTAATLERGVIRVAERAGLDTDSDLREVAALWVALADLTTAARTSSAGTARLGQLPLPAEYRVVVELRRQADAARASSEEVAEALLGLMEAEVDTIRPILLHEREFDRFTAQIQELSVAGLVGESERLQRETQPVRAALAEALERARSHVAAGRVPASMAEYLDLTLVAFQDFDALVVSAARHDEEGVQRALERWRDDARSLAAQDPARISAEFLDGTVAPLIATWGARVRDVDRQDSQLARRIEEQRLERATRWSW